METTENGWKFPHEFDRDPSTRNRRIIVNLVRLFSQYHFNLRIRNDEGARHEVHRECLTMKPKQKYFSHFFSDSTFVQHAVDELTETARFDQK